jgi:hypothetical protein
VEFFFSVCIVLEEKPAQAFFSFSLSFFRCLDFLRSRQRTWAKKLCRGRCLFSFLFFWVGIFNSFWCVPLSWIFVFFF